MIYIVLEIQSTGETASVIPWSFVNDFEGAMAKFHTILAAAAISSVPMHSAVIIDDQGHVVKAAETFRHTAPAVPQE